ncbi:MAG TPA: DUF4340 domain-containing protein [Steroidobacteraceae bacterium]|nr:DUF4340 domain-containing protein [Steroidobacteraceae bacterium]
MTRQRFVTLLVLALLVITAAIWLSSQRSLRRDDTAGARALPALSSSLNQVSEVRLVKAGDETAVTLKRADSHWQVGERADYPADSSKIRKLLIDLSDLKVVEQKTENPANYAVLGVEDVKEPTAKGVRVDIAGLAQPVSLIVGKNAGSRSSYARPAQSAQSLAVTPSISLDTDPKEWLDRSLLDIPAPRVQQVRITDANGHSYVAKRESRDQADFTVPDLPKGRKLTSPTIANSASTALGALTFDDVRPAAAPPTSPKGVARAEFRLFDGTVIEITGRKDGEHHWIHVQPRFDEAQQQLFAVAAAPAVSEAADAKAADAKAPPVDGEEKPAAPNATPAPAAERRPDEVRAEAENWAKRFAAWDYEVPGYKYDTLFRPLDEITQKP